MPVQLMQPPFAPGQGGSDSDLTKYFTSATRAATSPDFVNQIGLETDTHLTWQGTAITPGAWTATTNASTDTGNVVTRLDITTTGALNAINTYPANTLVATSIPGAPMWSYNGAIWTQYL